jgi:hypothetical protein
MSFGVNLLQPFRRYRDGHAIRHRVKGGGVSRPQLNNLLQLLVRNVGFDFELDSDSLESLANAFVKSSKPVQVNIAFKEGLDLFDINAACGRMIDDGRSQTSRERVKQMFAGVGSRILAGQNCRFIGLKSEGLRSRKLVTGAVKQVNSVLELLAFVLGDAAGDLYTAQTAHILSDATVERFGDALAVFGSLEFAFVGGIADKGNLG